jgi:Legionella pneumophila major outer membrane protein precursor
MPTTRCHLPQLRGRLLSATSYFCLAVFLANSELVEAADMGARPSFVGKAAPYQDRGFISVEGGYWFNGSESSLAFDRGDELVNVLGPTRPGRNGWTAAIAFGRTFGPQWDWAVAYRYTSLKTDSVAGSRFEASLSFPPTTESTSASASNRLWYQHLDLELGYRPPEAQSAGIRLFVGSRILNARQRMHYEYSQLATQSFDGFNTASKLGTFDHDVNLWGVGPRAGLQASVPLAQTPWSFNASASASMIFSRVQRDFAFNFLKEDFSPFVDSGAGATSYRTWRTVYNLEGSVALGYQLGNAAQLQVGYQVQQWWSLATRIYVADSEGHLQASQSDVLTHGPFAKITVALP